jgi:hypothetical protein
MRRTDRSFAGGRRARTKTLETKRSSILLWLKINHVVADLRQDGDADGGGRLDGW